MGNGSNSSIEHIKFTQQMLGELRTMALGMRLHMLAYLIEIAYIESSDQMRKVVSPDLANNKGNISA